MKKQTTLVKKAIMPTVFGEAHLCEKLGFFDRQNQHGTIRGTLYRSGVRKTGFFLMTFFVHETSVKTKRGNRSKLMSQTEIYGFA